MAIACRGVLVIYAAVAALCDLRTGKVPNWLLFPTFLYGILLRVLFGEALLLPEILGRMLLTILFFFPLWEGGGLGAGDIKMLAILPLFLDGGAYPACILFSFLSGAAAALVSLFRFRDPHRSIPFALPVAAGIFLCLLFEQTGIRYYS